MYNKGDLVIVNYKNMPYYESWADDYRGKSGIVYGVFDTGLTIEGFVRKDGFPTMFKFNEVCPVDKTIRLYVASSDSLVTAYCKGREYTINENCTMSELINLYKVYPNFLDTCYKVMRNQEGWGYAVANITWDGSQKQKKEFDDGVIFQNRIDAQEVVDEFNTILKKRRS